MSVASECHTDRLGVRWRRVGARARGQFVCKWYSFFLPVRWRVGGGDGQGHPEPEGKKMGALPVGRKEGGTLKCRRSLRASNLREESFYDTAAALHSAAAVTDRFGESLVRLLGRKQV